MAPGKKRSGAGTSREEAPVKVRAKGPRKKEEMKDEDMSEEDLALKQQLELYVERVQHPDPGLRKVALKSMRREIRASTSSMTSVPKPLKFLQPHYGTLKAYYETMKDSYLKRYLADILSVLASTTSAEGERECLKYRLLGSEGDIGSWGHEYVRNLAGEIAQEYKKRQSEEAPINDLMELVQQIVAFHMKHHAEPEAVDLLMEVKHLDMLMEHVDSTNFKKTCVYLTSAARNLPGPDVTLGLDTAYKIYLNFDDYANALEMALSLDDKQYVKQVFMSCGNFARKKRFFYILARHGSITFELDKEMVPDDDERKALEELVDNIKAARSLSVKNINFKTSEEDLRSHFVKFMEARNILNVSIKTRIATGTQVSAGWGQIEFDSVRTATNVRQILNRTILDGRALTLQLCRPVEPVPSSTTLFVGNIAPSATEEDIRKIFCPLGKVKSVTLPLPPLGTKRRIGFVEYSAEQEAQSALQRLGDTYLFGWRLVIEKAREKKNRDNQTVRRS
ncbi:26S proteasome non-ATPase regulatory subunit 2 homolog A-like [Syzygium oleosum]|uniref:26S proteasome non-ATPase regulatory subunit 2 homolog A-like n=1 Tax=Syzygium oleosum TaxID=219896 RepID=UPI0024BB477A|nr:26S proteasome non-ATPase regulatory subunit 2 homolog A-like [Syzygium oleosum]